ncbi:hypothetical protein CK203_101053 [Vitis vinifera]|uniref:PGG domain-containing protein n=1 Tax=Vitis vinifera TaxID=29760 RepID=A0A438FI88_VITVI|nr:hypothetical protein CK203_101053 [Vitis vinifera]
MVVVIFIATVVFAGAFTVPGGNSQDTGTSILLKEKSFMVFAIPDAIAVFTSSTSILMFLFILTLCYAEDNSL